MKEVDVNLLQMGDVLLLQVLQHASVTGTCAVCTTVRPPFNVLTAVCLLV